MDLESLSIDYEAFCKHMEEINTYLHLIRVPLEAYIALMEVGNMALEKHTSLMQELFEETRLAQQKVWESVKEKAGGI